jgi:hypothetical protein
MPAAHRTAGHLACVDEAWVGHVAEKGNAMALIPQPSLRRSPVWERGRPATPQERRLLGAALLAVGLLLAYLIYELWPAVTTASTPSVRRPTVVLFGEHMRFTPTRESALILLVVLAGALGAYIHAATAFGRFVGERRFTSSWYWWYTLRLPIGSALALVLYFVVRGGILDANGTSADVNPYGLAALAALAGMFSRHAVDKLNEVFDTVFTKREPDPELASDEAPTPHVDKVEPQPINSQQEQVLRLTGHGFDPTSAILIAPKNGVNGVLRRALKPPVREHELLLELAANELAPGDYELSVVNPPPGGGASTSVALRVA